MTYQRMEKVPVLKSLNVETEPRLVFRIEHPVSGRGPFTHDAGPNVFASDAMVWLHEPQEFYRSLGAGMGFHYAFKSINVLWGAVQKMVLLRELGFHIQVWESQEYVVLPDGQVAFTKSKAKLVRSDMVHEFPFEEFFEEVEA